MFQKEQFEITYVFENEENVSKIEKKQTAEVIQKRLSKFTDQVEVKSNSKNEIVVTLNSGFEIERLNSIVENQGKLDFWPCLSSKEIYYFILDVDEVLETNTIAEPFSSLVLPSSYGDVLVSVNDTLRVRQLLNDEKVKTIFKSEYKDLNFLFGQPLEEQVVLYGVTSNETGRSIINETSIIEARQDYDQINRPAVSIVMDEFGSHIWNTMTNDAYLNNTKIAITINDIVYSAPTVSSGPISGGRSQISGSFSLEEAQNLSYIFSSQRRIPKLKFAHLKKIENQ